MSLYTFSKLFSVTFCLVVCCAFFPHSVMAEDAKVPPSPPKMRAAAKIPTKRRAAVAQKAKPDLRPKNLPLGAVPVRTVPRTVPLVTAPTTPKETKAYWEQHKHGLVLRGAALFVPDYFLNGLFFDEADGVANGGFGIGYSLKTSRNFTFVFGVGYHFLNFIEGKDSDGAPIPHVFLNKGDLSYQREFIHNTLSYLAIDVRFLKTFPIHRHFQIMVGGGIGLGVVFGSLIRTDTFIQGYDSRKEQEYRTAYKTWKKDPKNSANALPNKACQSAAGFQDCQLHMGLDETKGLDTGNGRKENRVPPVIPLANFIFGLVFPIVPERWDIRLQGGIGVPRLFWAGLSTHIYF